MKRLFFITIVTLVFTGRSLFAQGDPDTGDGWVYAANPPLLPYTNAVDNSPSRQDAQPPCNVYGVQPLVSSPSVAEVYTTPEILSLAANLENDPKRIYDYVHNYIRYVHYFGCKKGALLTLLEGSGNDFDQCALLVALLRAAAQNLGTTASAWAATYQFGPVKMPYQAANNMDLMHWLGLTLPPTTYNDYLNIINNLNYTRGYPDYSGGRTYLLIPYQDTSNFIFHRTWVKFFDGVNTYYLDPAFKISMPISGIDIPTAMGLNTATLLTEASSGATAVTVDYVQGLNWNNIANQLKSYTTALLADFQNNHRNYSVEQVISGYAIQESDTLAFQQSQTLAFPGLPFQPLTAPFMNNQNNCRAIPILQWDNIPAAYMSALNLQVDNLNVTYPFPKLAARKISLNFPNVQAQIFLDDAPDQTGTTGSGSTATMTTTVTHPFGTWDYVNNAVILSHSFDQNDRGRTYQRSTTSGYAIVYGFDDPNQQLTRRQQKLDSLLRSYPSTDPKVITETLNVMGLSWLQQTYLAVNVIGSQKDVISTFHHRVGRVAQETGTSLGYYVDLPLNYFAKMWRAGVPGSSSDPENNVFKGAQFSLSAMEHGVIEQLQINTAASTVKSLYLANKNGQKLILGRSAFGTTDPGNQSLVQQTLLPNEPLGSRYSAADQSSLVSLLNANANFQVFLLLPSGYTPVGSWNGYGYAQLISYSGGSSFTLGIAGHLSGGIAGTPGTVDSGYTDNIGFLSSPNSVIANQPSQSIPLAGDPVNMLDGSFTVNSVDLSVGQPGPRGFSFARHYDTNRRYMNAANMANGWTHNYIIKAAERSDPAAGLGKNTPQEMAAFLAGMRAAYEVFTTTDSNPQSLHWAVAALISEWAVDQLKNNAVSITMGADAVQFIKQPDGTYTAPAGISMTLTKPNGYQLQQRFGNTFNFDSTTLRLNSIVDQYQKTMNFTYYTDGRLNKVTDCFSTPRILTFNYNTASPPQLTSISDNSASPARTVGFGYSSTSASADLLTVTDPESKVWSYVYDMDHKITDTKDPMTPSRTITHNIYDPTTARVTQQLSQNDPTKTWNIYTANRISVQKDPQGDRTVYYYDNKNRLDATMDGNGHKSLSVYDGQDHVVQQITPKGETTQFVYDGNQNLLQITDPLTKQANYFYDGQFQLDHYTDFRQKTTKYTYNGQHQVLTVTAPNVNDDPNMPNVITYVYNATDGANGPAGTVYSVTDQDSKVTTFQYDGWGQITRRTYNNNDYEQYVNNATGDVTQQTDARFIVSNYLYNNRRQLTQSTVVRSLGNLVTHMVYDDAGNLSQVTDPNQETTVYTYSSTKKLMTTTLPTLPSGTPVINNYYDSRDWLQSTSDPLTHSTGYGYDAGGRLSTVTDPLTHVTHYGYDDDNHRTSVTSPLAAQAQTTQYGYNARGEKTSLTDAATFAINYTYDDNGNPGQVLNRNGGPFNSVYYGDNRLFTSQTPLGKTTTFTYIKRGMPATVVKPSQQGTSLNTTFSYDDRGRLTGKVDPVGSSVYTPDPDNNVLTHTENGKTITRVYGDVNRLTSYTDEGGNQIGYQYDNNGNLLKLTYPGGKAVNYVYDSDNRLTTVTDWASRMTSITYDLAGRVLSVTRPNNTVRNIGYDNAGETTQIQELMPSPNGLIPIAYYKLVYDEAGRMTNEFIAPLPTAYSEPAETVVPDADNRIMTFNGLAVVHDPDGNMTSGPLNGNSLVTHVYDARNRLTAVGASGTAPALSYGYDSEGNRTSVTQGTQTTRYVVNPAGSQVLIRTRADGTQTFYVYGLGLLYDVEMTSAGVETGVQHTYHYDSRGSTIAVTSAAGAVTDRVQYSVYGRITLRTGSTDTPFLFNGRYGVQTDANGLYYMRARYYNPYICRFINADPAGFGGGMNWYAFADGNPVSLTDPFGLCAEGGISLLGNEGGLSNIRYWMDHPGTMPTIDQVRQQGVNDLKFDDVSTTQAVLMMAGGPQSLLSQLVIYGAQMAYPDVPVAAMVPGSPSTAASQEGSVWLQGWAARGRAIEQQLGGNLPAGFPVIDRFENGVATSIKSLDLNAATYQDANALASKVNGYVDAVATFNGAQRPGFVIQAAQISARQLQLAVPQGSMSAAQQTVINAATARAQSMGVNLSVISVK